MCIAFLDRGSIPAEAGAPFSSVSVHVFCSTTAHCSGSVLFSFCLQATYVHLQPHSLEALQARITAAILANPPLLYEPEEAAAKAAAEAVKEVEAAAARSELFDVVVTLDPEVSPATNGSCLLAKELDCQGPHPAAA
jgi:hypothetical protein